MSELARALSNNLPSGVTRIDGGAAGFLVASVRWATSRTEIEENPDGFAAGIAAGGVSAAALDMGGLAVPTAEEGESVRRFVSGLQLRGVTVVLHDVSAGFVTAASMDGDLARFAREGDLSGAVAVLREYDGMRRRCASRHGLRLNQLRMPARALCVPSLCAFVRDRMEHGGVEGDLLLGLLRATHRAMMEAVARSGSGAGDVSASATVHDGRATITLLDSGPPADAEVADLPDPGLDRMHRFRVLDRHNALVLEKDLAGGKVAGGRPDPVSS